jgi:hypothetical protein
MTKVVYNEDNIRSLDWKEHMRLRPGMYIGKTGDGSSQDDGIYILVKEVVDNSIDEFVMGYGKEIQFTKQGRKAILNKLVEAEGFEKFLHVKYTGTKRFGLDGAQAKTLEEVGKAFGVTRERIRQIEAKTLAKLRHPQRSQRLREFLEVE